MNLNPTPRASVKRALLVGVELANTLRQLLAAVAQRHGENMPELVYGNRHGVDLVRVREFTCSVSAVAH